jgi:hypothetical protein
LPHAEQAFATSFATPTFSFFAAAAGFSQLIIADVISLIFIFINYFHFFHYFHYYSFQPHCQPPRQPLFAFLRQAVTHAMARLRAMLRDMAFFALPCHAPRCAARREARR